MVRWLARTICSCAVRLGLCAGGTLFACTHGAARAPPHTRHAAPHGTAHGTIATIENYLR